MENRNEVIIVVTRETAWWLQDSHHSPNTKKGDELNLNNYRGLSL